MTIETSIEMSQETQPIPDDKFDRHMKKARENDIESRKKSFVRQTEEEVIREHKRSGLRSSVY